MSMRALYLIVGYEPFKIRECNLAFWLLQSMHVLSYNQWTFMKCYLFNTTMYPNTRLQAQCTQTSGCFSVTKHSRCQSAYNSFVQTRFFFLSSEKEPDFMLDEWTQGTYTQPHPAPVAYCTCRSIVSNKTGCMNASLGLVF